jgi:chemotaxis protein MotB
MYDDDFEETPKKEPQVAAWMLTFADLVSLLICFFVLLYAMKTVNENIWKQITGSFAGALNYSQKFKKITPNNESGVDAQAILKTDDMEYIESVLNAKFAKESLSEYVSFNRNFEDNSLHIIVPGKYMFVDDTNKITPKGESILVFISETVQYINDDLEIANYVKSSDDKRAMQKSMLRSLAVKEFVLSKGSKKTIKIVGFGSVLYDDMKDIMSQEELDNKTIKLDFIIRSKV